MAKLDYAVTEMRGTGKIATTLKAVMLSMLATLVALSLLALFITYGPVRESAINSCVLVAVIVSIFVTSASVSNKSRSKGWLSGIITAAVYVAVMVLLGALVFGSFSPGEETLKILGVSLVSGCFGGIVGVNIKFKRKRK